MNDIDIHERQGLAYISGYIARKISEKLSCQKCLDKLHCGKTVENDFDVNDSTNELYHYLMSLSRGGLLVPSNELLSAH